MADTADLTKKLPRESTFQSVNTVLGQILTTLQNRSTDIPAWKDAVLALPTADKNSLKSAIYEVLGLNSSTQTSIEALPDIYEILDSGATAENGSGLHNSLYRGKNLGSAPTADQLARVNDGTFKGLWVGDYWSKSITFNYLGVPRSSSNGWVSAEGANTNETANISPIMRICDHDYYLRAGDNIDLQQHHLDIAPDEPLYFAPMNQAKSDTTGAYVGSEMRTKYLAAAENAFNIFFGSAHLLSYRDALQNAVANGKASGHAWTDCKVELMDERQVYGSLVYDSGSSDGSTIPPRYTVSTKQFALFRVRPDLISKRQSWWLRNVVSSSFFALVGDDAVCSYHSSSLVLGVRPAALIY